MFLVLSLVTYLLFKGFFACFHPYNAVGYKNPYQVG